MALRNRTEAYDLSFFESRPLRVEVGGQPAEKPSKKQQNRNNVIELPKKELERNRRRHPHSLRAVGVVCVLTLMLTIIGSVVFNQVQLNELTTQITQAEAQLSHAESTHTQLQMRASSSMTLSDVEEFASEQLGMGKIGKKPGDLYHPDGRGSGQRGAAGRQRQPAGSDLGLFPGAAGIKRQERCI